MIISVFVLTGFAFVLGNADFDRIDAIRPELRCLAAGGMCTVATDCPDGNLLEQRGLCPNQRHQGIECCFGLSTKETRCAKRGGICMKTKDHCNKRLLFHNATDCLHDQRCCIMV